MKNESRLEFAVRGGWRKINARIVNMSRDGALVVSDQFAAEDARIWLRIEHPVKSDWVEATIVRLGSDREVALSFPRGCPDDLLLAGTIGIDLTSMVLDRSSFASTFD